jgi:hypothetical protein
MCGLVRVSMFDLCRTYSSIEKRSETRRSDVVLFSVNFDASLCQASND